MKNNSNNFSKTCVINWNLDEKGILTIHGEGKIPDCDCGKNPAAEWDSVKNEIVELRVEEGITEIGINAFRGCENLKRVFLPGSLQRIYAFAFRDCEKLSLVEEKEGRAFQYIYDKTHEDNPIVFGLETFHNTPWSLGQWGDFYIKNETLYVVFPGGSRSLEIPFGVRVLNKYAFFHLELDSVTFPRTLKTIENFAFSGCRVRDVIDLPCSVTEIAEYALADCGVKLTANQALRRMNRYHRGLAEKKQKRFPVMYKRYTLSVDSKKVYGDFQKLKIKEKKIKENPGAMYASCIMDNRVDVGRSIYARIRRGKIVLCITRDHERIVSVKSFAWDNNYDLINEYLMYPVMKDCFVLEPWQDSFTYQETFSITDAFDLDGRMLYENDCLRQTEDGVQEEWYCSDDRGNFGGPLELKLLENWMFENSDVTVDNVEENINNDRYRWFVEV